MESVIKRRGEPTRNYGSENLRPTRFGEPLSHEEYASCLGNYVKSEMRQSFFSSRLRKCCRSTVRTLDSVGSIRVRAKTLENFAEKLSRMTFAFLSQDLQHKGDMI